MAKQGHRPVGVRSLRTAILLPLAFLVILGFCASGVLYLLSSRAAVRYVIEQLALETTSNLEARLSRLLDTPRQVGVTISEFIRFEENSFDPAIFQRIFYSQLREIPDIEIISIGFPDGEYAEAQRLPDGTVYTGRAGRMTGGALESWTCDEDGVPVRLVKSMPGYDPRTRPWYQRAALGLRPGWSEVYPYYSNSDLAVASSVPILSGGELVAVVSVTISLRSISSFLASVIGSRAGLLAVVDGKGALIAASDGAATAFLPDGSLPRASDSPNILLSNAASLLNLRQNAPAEVVRFRINSRQYIAGTADLGNGELSPAWRSLIVLSGSEYMQRLTESDVRSSFVFFVLLTMAFLVAWWMIGRLLKPLGLLKTAVGDVARGCFSRNVTSTVRSLAMRRDEIGELAASFEDMRERLSDSFSSLKANLEEKEVLLKEVHHRVKNNLQVISSMLSIQSGELKNPVAEEAFAACQERIQAMAFVHEGVYQSGMYSEIDMGDYMGKVCESLRWSRGCGPAGAEIRVDVRDVSLPISLAIPCGLIVNELTVNALKHAFPADQAGSILVSLSGQDSSYRLVVEDNGVGLSSADAGVRGGIGQKLVESLVVQLRGRMEAGAGTGGRGYRVEIRFGQ